MNNYTDRNLKQKIINHFFSYEAIPCDKIFYMEGLFQTLLTGEYNYNR